MPAATSGNTPRAIITDIEGTTSSIAFVKSVLFPYARKHLVAFIRSHDKDPQVRRWLVATADAAGLDVDDTTAITATLIDWIDNDRKATPLKALQGMIWADGYTSRAYRAHLYPDVSNRLREWHAQGIALYVYSSGSVAAQKLFFGYSEAGDLTPLISGWFDTETGPKREAASYAAIAKAIHEAPADCLFLSDIAAELDAATSAGMCAIQLCRPADGTVPAPRHTHVASFDQITF
ncbi:MAG TPA: acireductone synthase [Rhodanobacteraceae bacterium]